MHKWPPILTIRTFSGGFLVIQRPGPDKEHARLLAQMTNHVARLAASIGVVVWRGTRDALNNL